MKTVITVVLVCFLIMDNFYGHAEMAVPANNRRLLSETISKKRAEFATSNVVDDSEGSGPENNSHHRWVDGNDPTKRPRLSP
ncbi:hypothetical protein C2S52_014367 [Perilla frutescens var. hirtella]|uniref:Uncharacterized protein n=1 Tax=Perilla frutescens var. hirtella TaxID=608512 RepID=A0AAD4P9D9_PERFH|nr:hypothetical protein C2S52_014367 [Perilla frutescens var. hirtella]KAH6816769.1 hypothetical protein C2S51_021589 [Perilla frutescens var. frutescens]KAH6831834.1 hypothetical protein C2S53_008327 [Perilla frutescens var. hirtella]